MSNPARAPVEPTLVQLQLATGGDAYLPEGFANRSRAYKKVEAAQEALQCCDMLPAPAFAIPRDLSIDGRVTSSSRAVLATAKTGVATARVRSSYGAALRNVALGRLPEAHPFAARGAVEAKCRTTVFVDGGVETTLGRIRVAYPAKGVRPSRPVTKGEAAEALVNSGLLLQSLPAPALRPYPLVAAEGELSVQVNKNSSNGLPVGGKWKDPGAAPLCYQLAKQLRMELEALPPDGVAEWKRTAERERPYLVALLGAAKGDYYSLEKVVEARMRYYNVLPRPILLNMQMATQVADAVSRNILTAGNHTFAGVSLYHGGAQELVDALDAQLQETGEAYVHMGDDTWCVRRDGQYIEMFALDCSNFDLTQHDTVTAAVHEALRDQLRLIDRKAADLWHAYARERMVVLTGSLVRMMKHGGPSGMPLQSKVNDMLMDVLVQRTLAAMRGSAGEALASRAVEEAGRSMGFSVRLEQYGRYRADSLLGALEQAPFLFVGYYFHVREGRVCACCDVARTLAQVPYPSIKWAASHRELQVVEAMRLGSIAMAMGVPPAPLEEAFAAFRQGAADLVDQVLSRFGDVQDEKLAFATQLPSWDTTRPSLSGLRSALSAERIKHLWLVREAPLPSVSTLVYDWADDVENEEERQASLAGGTARRPAQLEALARLRALRMPRLGLRTVTPANDGRTASTVRPTASAAPVHVRDMSRRKGREGLAARDRARYFAYEVYEEMSSDDSEYASDY